jgi:ERCC4-related helicase
MAITVPPEQGQLVSVRQRQWVVSEVAQSALPDSPLQTVNGHPQHLITLSSIEDDALGEELQVVWELEPGATVSENVALPDPTGFDAPERLDAFLDAVRWGAASTADVRSIQAPFRSGIVIEDYQLDPVVRAIQMPRANLLIADDVGLGKTIEAGMTVLELIIRHRARRVLVVCPASLLIQWRDQMRDKFGLEFRIVDSELMRDLRRKRGIHVNPWTHFPRLITSIDFLKRERPLRLFKETLPAEGESVYPRRYDVLILDESHNCAPSGRGKYARDSDRTEAIRLLAPHFEHKLFLTATPHNGYPESFTALLELLDNQRFARGTPPDRKQLNAVMVRRLKTELPKDDYGNDRFPKRTLEAIEVDYPEDEKRIHAALREYTKLRHEQADDASERFATEFVLLMLKKRLFSSPAAFAITLAKHENSLSNAKKRKYSSRPTHGILQRQVDRVDEEYAIDDDAEEAAQEAIDTASLLFHQPTGDELALLKEMKTWAERAKNRLDAKAHELVRWLHKNIRPGGKWSNNRVIIFTEYRATQNWLQGIFAAEGFTASDDRLLTIYGGMDSKERERVKAAFQTDPKKSNVRLLLATDAASEGIDLQNHCSNLIHYEIPWNPNRLEQRNGRIDRHGQKAKAVLIHHFVGKGYNDRESRNVETKVGDLDADLEFLMRAVRKIETIREDLGKVGPVIAEQVVDAMLGRRTRLDTRQEEADAEPVRKLLKFERDLAKQIKELMDQLNEAKREMRLEPDNVQKVVAVALELVGQPALIPTKAEGIWPDPKRHACPIFNLPALTGSWEECATGLTHPFSGERRPFVFDHNLARGREDVVLVHLNHRLVQMSLRLLRAEVWSREGRKRLHRITARTVPDTALQHLAMIAHARLVVIGGDCHRLHEEIITAGGLIREGRFARFGALREMHDALAAATDREPSNSVKEKLQVLWPKNADALRQALEARKDDLTNGLKKKLTERAEKEALDITTILTELQKAIHGQMSDPFYQQAFLPGMVPAEQEQFERNVESLRRRLREIPKEIEKETEAVRKRFANPQPRMFPVAVTFLVPEKLAR